MITINNTYSTLRGNEKHYGFFLNDSTIPPWRVFHIQYLIHGTAAGDGLLMVPHLCFVRGCDRDTSGPSVSCSPHESNSSVETPAATTQNTQISQGNIASDATEDVHCDHLHARTSQASKQGHKQASPLSSKASTSKQGGLKSRTHTKSFKKRSTANQTKMMNYNHDKTQTQGARFTTPPNYQTLSINENGHGDELVRVVSYDEADFVNRGPVAIQSQVYPSATYSSFDVIAPCTVRHIVEQDAEDHAMHLVGHVQVTKQAFTNAGFNLSDEKMVELGLQNAQFHFQMISNELNEIRNIRNKEHYRAQNYEHEERHHQENMHTAKEDKDWHKKLRDARMESFAALMSLFLYAISSRVATGVFFRLRRIHQGGLEGAVHGLHGFVMDQCHDDWVRELLNMMPSSLASPTSVAEQVVATESSFYATFRSAFLGAPTYLYETAASTTAKALNMTVFAGFSITISAVSTAITTAPCYAVHLALCLMAVVLACGVLTVTANWSFKAKVIIYGMYAIAFSGLSWIHVGAFALVYIALMSGVWVVCRRFEKEHSTKTPVTHDMTQIMLDLEDLVNLGWLLPWISVGVYFIYEMYVVP
jgi:hypothetical protein